MNETPYKKIHVVINPASGKDEPILNVINDVFHQYEVDWSISVTRKFGDTTKFARKAAHEGADLVAGCGDGTQHEIANGILGTQAIMGVLPGGTGNGFATELGTPKELRPALELFCTKHKVRKLDVVQMGTAILFNVCTLGLNQKNRRVVPKRINMAHLLMPLTPTIAVGIKNQKSSNTIL
jgi:diacylglycerol kinase family enzyme